MLPLIPRNRLATMGGGPAAAAATAQGATRRIPFVRASYRYLEPFIDTSFTPGAGTIALGPFDVPAYGFIRAVRLLITSSGGVIGTGVLSIDAPFSVLRDVTLQDTSGYPIIFPISGHDLFLVNAFGGYRGFNDPTVHPDFSNTINPVFSVRLPVEITPHDAFGSLANQNPESPFRVRITGGTSGDLLSTVGTATLPLVRIRGYLEAWAPVPPADMNGNPQNQMPPGHGAVQYWSKTTPVLNSGVQQIRLTRVGNLIRNLVLVFRDSTGLRSALVEPDELTLRWDQRQVFTNMPNQVQRADNRDSFGFNDPTGVLVIPFHDDVEGIGGNESRHMWLPTVGSTRLELEGNFGAAGNIHIITNDVAVTAEGY